MGINCNEYIRKKDKEDKEKYKDNKNGFYEINGLIKEPDYRVNLPPSNHKSLSQNNPEVININIPKIYYNTMTIGMDIPSKEEIILNDLRKLKDKVMLEIELIEKRKKNFLIKYKAKDDKSFSTFNNIINNELKEIENAFNYSKKKLCKIKEKIENISNNKFIESSTYDALNNQMESEINNQNEIESQFIRKKKEKFIEYIYSMRDKLNNLGEKINEIKNNFKYCFNKFQNVINLINQKENDIKSKSTESAFKFMACDIKIEKSITKILEEKKNNLIIHSNTINNKINQLIQLNKKIYSIKNQIESYNNFENDEEYKRTLKLLEDIENEAVKEIEDSNKNNASLLISKINSEVQSIENNTLYIIQNSFYDKEEEGDSTYNKLIKKEKKIMSKIVFENRKKVIDIILKINRVHLIPNLNINLIKNIVINEDSYNNFKNKIIEKINIISNDNEKFKIANLNILLVGRRDAGIPTLIKYILGENLNIYKYNDNFTRYSNSKIDLKLIKAKEIDYDADKTIDVIEKNISDFINNANNNNDINDFNNVIHCIWYCITKTRFEGKEEELFNYLKNIYKDNIIPIIIVYTKANDRELAKNMENEIKNYYKINNSFIPVLAKNITLTNNKQKLAFGKDELLKTTLEKCSKALQSDISKIMIQQISKSIEKDLFTENINIAENIKGKALMDFSENFKNVYQNGDFIKYIFNIFFKHLKDFYNKEKIISNKSKNLFLKSDFITSIYNIYSSYMVNINNLIEPIAEKTSKEFIDIQATLEKKNKNINIINKRILNQFRTTTKIFLRMNFYYIGQNYIVYYVIQPQKYLDNYLSLMTKEFSKIIHNLTDLNNREKDSSEIREHLYGCYKQKLKAFYDNNISLKHGDNIKISINNNIPPNYSKSQKRSFNDEPLENPFKNVNSFEYNKNEYDKYKSIEAIKPNDSLVFCNDNELDSWKFLIMELRSSVRKFLEEIKYQESSFDLNKDDNTYAFFRDEIKKDLISILNDNLYQYINQLILKYGNHNYITNFDDNIIEQIIINEKSDMFYQNQIRESLSLYANIENGNQIKHIKVIIAGKGGVGKSTLINALLEADAPVSEGKVGTLETKTYKNKNKYPFLILTDTRGYEIDKEKYNPDDVANEVMKTIKLEKEKHFVDYIEILWDFLGNEKKSNIDDNYQCIWFCVNGNELSKTEIESLEKLTKNNQNLPLIIVFTNAQIQEEVDNMKNQIKNIFPDLKFIHTLAKKSEDIDKFGLDELLNLTLETIKSMKKNDMINEVIKEYKKEEETMIKCKISDIKASIINKTVREFISNYTSVLNEEDFKQYIYHLIDNLIMFISNKMNINKKTKELIRKNKIKNFIDSFISFNNDLTQQFLNNIIEKKSLEYLDNQVKIEKTKKESIMIKYKRNREDFKKLITKFCQDNFYYIAQKYLIYKLIKDLLEYLSEKICQNILVKIENYLLSKEIAVYFRKIYIKRFENFEKTIDAKRNINGKIYC